MWSQMHSYTAVGAPRQKLTHILRDMPNSHVCYGPTGQWTVTRGSQSWTAALMKGAEGHSHAYVTHTTHGHTRARTHTHTHKAVFLLLSPFWTVYLDTGKGQGLCISHCAQKGSYTGPEPGGVSSPCVCVCVAQFVLIFLSSLLSLASSSVFYCCMYVKTDINRKSEEQIMS